MQPFELRCAILYCLQCYLYKNPKRQEEVMSTLLPNHEAKDENDITAVYTDGCFEPKMVHIRSSEKLVLIIGAYTRAFTFNQQ